MLNTVKKYMWAVYLGVVLAYLGIHVDSIQYWVILVPLALLVTLSTMTVRTEAINEFANKLSDKVNNLDIK